MAHTLTESIINFLPSGIHELYHSFFFDQKSSLAFLPLFFQGFVEVLGKSAIPPTPTPSDI